MAWTTFDSEQPELIRRLTERPAELIPELVQRASTARPGERLRILGLLVSAYAKTGQVEAAQETIHRGDQISARLAKATAHGEFSVYAATFEAQHGQEWKALSRVNVAIKAATAALNPKATTAHGRACNRRRAIVAAWLFITRANICFYRFDNPRTVVADVGEALALLPGTRRLRPGTVAMIRRSCRAALDLLAVALADGAPIPAHLASRLEVAEDLFDDLSGIEAAQIARCRAVLLVKRGELAAAEMLMIEALHWCIEAEAQAEFEQTLEMLARLVGRRRAGRTLEDWRQKWASRLESTPVRSSSPGERRPTPHNKGD